MADAFDPVLPGQPWKPPAARAWNAMLRAGRAFQRGQRHVGGPVELLPETSTEVNVSNTTGADVVQFGVLGVTGPITTQAADAATFGAARSLVGAAPVALGPFVITQEPIGAGFVGRATLLGLTPCTVTINNTAHRYADCTTATDKLSSGPTGRARILWDEDNFAAAGDKWALVLLGAVAPASYVRFTLPGALATTDASKASCTVDSYFGGSSPGTTITAYNLPASANYVFSGASGNKGLAVWDDVNARYQIIQMQCP